MIGPDATSFSSRHISDSNLDLDFYIVTRLCKDKHPKKYCVWFRSSHIFRVYPRNFVHHDDVIKWKHFPRYWPFLRGIHRSPVNSPHKGQWSGALMFSVIRAWMNCWVSNREAGDLRRHRAHYDFTVMRSVIRYVLLWFGADRLWQCLTRDRLTKAYDVIIQRYRKSHTKMKFIKMHILYGFKRCTVSNVCVKFQRCLLCGISHKILNTYTAKYAFYEVFKVRRIMIS